MNQSDLTHAVLFFFKSYISITSCSNPWDNTCIATMATITGEVQSCLGTWVQLCILHSSTVDEITEHKAKKLAEKTRELDKHIMGDDDGIV